MFLTRNSNRLFKVFFILLCFFIPQMGHGATWQTSLESNFMFVETFDQLNDWYGKSGTSSIGNVWKLDHPTDFPTKIGGGDSLWAFYSDYSNTHSGPWIGNHGAGNVWEGTKSLKINYWNSSGPSRMAMYVGNNAPNTPAEFIKEVYAFYMIKIDRGFFPDPWGWWTYVKMFVPGLGWRDGKNWGTTTESSHVSSSDTCSGTRAEATKYEYGCNGPVFNLFWHGGTQGVYYDLNDYTCYKASSNCHRYVQVIDSAIDWTTYQLNIKNKVNSTPGLWYGVEYHGVRSTPAGSANGVHEFWIYNADGTVNSHFAWTGLVNFTNGVDVFNHAWNRFEWGGNRSEEFSSAKTATNYIDDIIIHKSRIGPTYFSLKQGGGASSPISAPKELKISQ
jgi:hypothetical protein